MMASQGILEKKNTYTFHSLKGEGADDSAVLEEPIDL